MEGLKVSQLRSTEILSHPNWHCVEFAGNAGNELVNLYQGLKCYVERSDPPHDLSPDRY